MRDDPVSASTPLGRWKPSSPRTCITCAPSATATAASSAARRVRPDSTDPSNNLHCPVPPRVSLQPSVSHASSRIAAGERIHISAQRRGHQRHAADCQRRILFENPAFERAQLVAGLEPESLDQRPAGSLVGGQRIALGAPPRTGHGSAAPTPAPDPAARRPGVPGRRSPASKLPPSSRASAESSIAAHLSSVRRATSPTANSAPPNSP